MTINWYPGHMTKTRRLILEELKGIDIIVELVDARIPRASKNPDLEDILKDKSRIIILNKNDLSDPIQNKLWIEYYKSIGFSAISFNSKNVKDKEIFYDVVKTVYAEKEERNIQRGMVGKNARIMVLGIPNVGKSTFINKLSGSVRAKAEDRPGVTRGKQWISLPNGIDMLDMPGILWPKLTNQKAAERLAITGAIKDAVVDIESLAMCLLEILSESYANLLVNRYKIDVNDAKIEDKYELLKIIGKKRGFIIAKGEIDTLRAANILIDEFRAGILGKISLETVAQFGKNEELNENNEL